MTEETLNKRQIVAFACMMLGMFMAILDIQIVSSSLTEIRTGLSATPEESAWIQTSYLMAEVVMIPLSGFLARALSTRYLFAFSAASFTLMSVFCAVAQSIEEMIVWRAFQGFLGGAMIPSVFAGIYTVFPPSKRYIVTPMVGLLATLAPAIGPTVGGYITDYFSWHWIFLINLGPGLLVAWATWRLVDFDQPHFDLLKKFDWVGFISMASFLGALEYVLEEGSIKYWWESTTIVVTALISASAGIIFFWRCFKVDHPIVDLRVFSDRNFWTASACSFVLGIGMFGLTYLYPLYLGQGRNYSALMTGETLIVTGISMFVTAPVVGRLAPVLDARLLISVGFFGLAISTYLTCNINVYWDFWELFWPQIIRGASLILCILPITNAALGHLPKEQLKNASGLFNLTRNLGGAVGIAVINTLLTKRSDFHAARLQESFTLEHFKIEETLDQFIQLFKSDASRFFVDSTNAALKQFFLLLQQHAFVMALSDIFYVLSGIFLVIPLLLFLMKRSQHIEDAPLHG